MNTRRIALFGAVLGCLMLAGSIVQAADEPLATLVANLKSADEAVRLQAIDQIGDRGEKAAEAVAPLTELLQDGSAKVRAHAVWALGAIGAAAKPAVPALAELVKDPDETVRRQVVKAVMHIHPGPQVTIPLCIKLLQDPDPGVQARILNAISEAGPQAVPGLIEALKNEKAAYWACVVLRDMGPPAKDAVPALVEAIQSKDPEVRREAILALAAMEDAAVPAVEQDRRAAVLGDETRPHGRHLCAGADRPDSRRGRRHDPKERQGRRQGAERHEPLGLGPRPPGRQAVPRRGGRAVDRAAEGQRRIRPRGGGAGLGLAPPGPGDHVAVVGEGVSGCRRNDGPVCPGRLCGDGSPGRAPADRRLEAREDPRAGDLRLGADGPGRGPGHAGVGQAVGRQE